MEKQVAVKVNHVKKSFRLPTESTSSLKRTITNYFKGVKGYKEQTVLKDISFEVSKGDFFGIVGRNGSGKSTLLKIISQIYQPNSGSVEVNGKLVSFIELGVGFNPELTGKENVYLNGALLGFSTAEIDDMYEDIVNFAELKDFMNQKLKNYSSGMQVRLAFSVAIRVNSDILVLDEVLAVGDEAFQRKCNDYFMNAKEEEKTIILVTHSMEAVRKYCNKAILIDMGEIKLCGNPDEVANQYSLDNVMQTGASTIIEGEVESSEVNKDSTVVSAESLEVKLLSPQVLSSTNQQLKFSVSYDTKADIKTYVAFSLTDIDRNVWMYNDNSYDYMVSGEGRKYFTYTCNLGVLNHCKLKLNVSVRNDKDEPFMFADEDNSPVIVITQEEAVGKSERISSSGVLKRNGSWNIINKGESFSD